MKAVLKIEFQRLFRSVTFYISMGIGLILTMTQFVMVGLQESMHILDAYSPKGISEPYGYSAVISEWQDRRWCTARFII